MNGKERHCLEWFVRRASVKLPGIFGSTFWNKLVLSLGLSERAILHAILALGSAHKREMLDIGRKESVQKSPDEEERFTLQQYCKAINHLQPLFAYRSRASVRIILIVCVIFTCLDYLRGRYRTGYAHLRNGLMLLRDVQILPSTRDDNNSLILKAPAESIDMWLVETFMRLDVQATLFGYSFPHSLSIQNLCTTSSMPITFSSVHEARQYLDIILLEIFNLKEKYQKKHMIRKSTSAFECIASQKRISEASVSWLRAYNASKVALETEQSFRDVLAYQLLLIYHTMAHIMGETSLHPSEFIFDSYTDHFHAIITQSLDILAAASPLTTHDISSGNCTPKFSFITDIGIIPPLYYTSLKCRDPSIRRQAIHLLETATHHEGIWNGKLVAVVSKEVMRIEERDFYDGVSIPDYFTSPSHGGQNVALRVLPEYHRVHDVRIVLPDDPHGKTILLAEGKQNYSAPTTLRREYDAMHRTWA